jgi:ubiquinone/menaquinone biosynthesis C-methylase UbiE
MTLRKPADARIWGKHHPINYDQTLAFFSARGSGATLNHLTATMYQDPALAARRDEAEKRTVLPVLAPRPDDRVLDLGCGAGRWADALAPCVAEYLGIDFSENLLRAARKRVPNAFFQAMDVSSLDIAALQVAPPFSVIICSGVLAYINDADLLPLFEILSRVAAAESRIYVREPIAKIERLTLDECWSDELQASYSAIYRTRTEYLNAFEALVGFQVRVDMEPFASELQNRIETQQYCFVLERRLSW